MPRTTILDMQKLKDAGKKIAMLTAYDATSAHLAEAAGIQFLLVGDSLGMVVQGHQTTIPVTLDAMIYHTQMVVRGTQKALVIGDMPFMTYKINPEQAMQSAARMMQESGAGAVKIEGGASMGLTVRRLVESGIPVMAHIGLTPQSFHQLGGWRVQGRKEDGARTLLADAIALQDAGAFAIVLETIPSSLAGLITERLRIPTIGIGAGPLCAGQVQVWHDILGLIDGFVPKHAKKYAGLAEAIKQAVATYESEVTGGVFPTAEHGMDISPEMLRALYGDQQEGGQG
jgi:3-methyl-2-oxobutanoate hydroxymethyltransferase